MHDKKFNICSNFLSKYIFLILISDITLSFEEKKFVNAHFSFYVRIGMSPSGLEPPTGARSIFF